MPLTYTTADFTSGSVISATDVNSRFDEIKTKFAAGIVNGDVSASAALSVDKLDANFEHMVLNFKYGGTGGAAATWPAAGVVVQAIPIPDDGKGNWVVTYGELVCTDTGDENGQVRFEWGRYTTGAWAVSTTVVTAVIINDDETLAVNTAGQQTLAIASGTLTAGTHRSLAMVSAAAGTALLSGNNDYISASFMLRRKIANG